MPLDLRDLLEKGDFNMLCKGSLQYSSLVSIYCLLVKDKHRKILDEGISFLELLCDSGLNINVATPGDNQQSSITIEEDVTRVLSQKIRIGLMAVDEIPVHDIAKTILRMDSNFASDRLILRICDNDSRLKVKQSGKNKVVVLSQCPESPAEKNNETTENQATNDRSDAREFLLRFFYKSRPNLLKAVQPEVKYKDLLKIYDFWSSMKHKDTDFFKWLFALSQTHSKEDFQGFKKNIYEILTQKIIDLVRESNRAIYQLVEYLCIDKPSFIDEYFIRELVLKCPILEIMQESHNQPVAYQKVEIIKTSESDYQSGMSNIDYLQALQSKRNVDLAPVSAVSSSDFDLPKEVDIRVKNLLTLRTTFQQMKQIYNNVHNKAIVQAKVEKYGCFLGFLAEMGRVCKPTKLGGNVFDRHLKTTVLDHLMSLSDGKDKTFENLREIALVAATHGFINDDFLRDALIEETRPDICVDGGEPVNAVEKGAENPDIAMEEDYSHGSSIADLESPRVIHLLTRQPRFSELSHAFSTLPESAIRTLAKSSMSFFEWTISLCKRLMPYDAEVFETHLQELVQCQVAKLHSTEHCQMTIQHVHTLLCDKRPMLLSPNFISYCLEQPGSTFCVYQSWIYLRNEQRDNTIECPQMPMQQMSKTFDVKNFIHSVTECTSLQQIISIINCISLEHKNIIMESESCWYEFMENTSTHQGRKKLAALLVTDVSRLLAGTVQKLANLRGNICKGLTTFITTDILEEVLRQHRERFALSNMSGESCYVARVRNAVNEGVECVDAQEEKFLERVLFCFPSKGSCNVTVVLGLVNKEHSSVHTSGQKLDVNFLECFFKAFPMLFYLNGGICVLTCMALDLKLKFIENTDAISTEENVEAMHRGKKRTKRENRSAKSKRKRCASTSDKDHHNVIWIKDSEEEDNITVENMPRFSDGCPDPNDVKEAIDTLLPDLVGDMIMSLLNENNGRYAVIPLIKEMVSMILGQDEAYKVVSSTDYWSMFKRKITEIVKMDSRFETAACSQDEEAISEVMIAEEGICRDNDIVGIIEDNAQVREITSTSVSPIPDTAPSSYPNREDNTATMTATSQPDDIITLTPPRPTNTDKEAQDRLAISTTNHEERSESPKDMPDPGFSQRDNCGVLIVDVAGSPDDPRSDTKSDKSPTVPGTNPSIPSYSSLTSGSTAYKYIQANSKRNERVDKSSRDERFHNFLREYFRLSAGSCATELLIADAYRRLRNERFARSRLAFEAYLFEFIVDNSDSYTLTGTSNEIGVSKTSFKSTRSAKADHAFRVLWALVPGLCPSIAAFLSSRPRTRACIDDISRYIIETFHENLRDYPDTEIFYAVRCLCLVAVMQNLQVFLFAVNEPEVYLRGHRENASEAFSPEVTAKIKSVMQSERLQEAVLLMATIIEKSIPSSQKKVREVWQTNAPKSISSVFGTGISFTLALREYSCLFPQSGNGEVSINLRAIDAIKKEVGRRRSPELS